jgi:hypothetical protein
LPAYFPDNKYGSNGIDVSLFVSCGGISIPTRYVMVRLRCERIRVACCELTPPS